MSAAVRGALPARGARPAGKRPVLIVGGPRFDELMAAELGVDRIFGRGTTPREVASYLVHAIAGRADTGKAETGRATTRKTTTGKTGTGEAGTGRAGTGRARTGSAA